MNVSHKNSQPLVSVIVITYNSEKFVIETLNSVIAQTHKNIELVISDDGSSDKTIKLCQSWLNKNKNRFVNIELILSEKNTGISANCNRGVKASKGEWLKLIAGDDVLLPETISYCLNYITSKPNEHIQILHGEMNVYKQNFLSENFIRKTDFSHFKQHHESISAAEQFQIFLRRGFLNAPAMIINKNVFDTVGYFDENYTLYEDTPFILKCLEKNIKLFYINVALVNYRKSENSVQILKSKSNQLLSNYQLQRDAHTLKEIIPKLPTIEKLLKIYVIYFRLIFTRIGLNHQSVFSKLILYFFTHFINLIIIRFEKRYY